MIAANGGPGSDRIRREAKDVGLGKERRVEQQRTDAGRLQRYEAAKRKKWMERGDEEKRGRERGEGREPR
jgi:hypothetical protein